jgi:LPS-assembly lipoprotein
MHRIYHFLRIGVGFLSLCLLLSGCGFHPLYSGNPAEQQGFDLHIKGEGYSTYKLRRELEKNLAYVPKFDEATYRLDVTVTETRQAVVFARDASVTRNQETLLANYSVSQGGKTLLTSTASVVTSYPLTPSAEYVTRVAEGAASRRSAIALAEEISRDVLRQLKGRCQKP